MKACSRCEALPDVYPAEGTLYLAPPVEPVVNALKAYLKAGGFEYQEPFEDIFAVALTPNFLVEFSRDFCSTLGRAELRDTKCFIVAEDRQLNPRELTQMQPLQTLVARIQGEWLIELLHEERLVSVFQPIVSCGESVSVYGHECLLRGKDKDGETVSPGLMFGVARDGDLLFYLDRAARLSAITHAHKHNLPGKIFINFNPTSIYKPSHCLQTTLRAIKKAGIAKERVVFEVVESDEIRDTGHLVELMEYYRMEGFGVALDDLGAGYGSLNLLNNLRPDYIKLDLELVRDVDRDPYKATIAANLLDMAGKLGITSLAEGVETEGEYRWCVENGADLMQGYLFGRPSEVPAVTVECPAL